MVLPRMGNDVMKLKEALRLLRLGFGNLDKKKLCLSRKDVFVLEVPVEA